MGRRKRKKSPTTVTGAASGAVAQAYPEAPRSSPSLPPRARRVPTVSVTSKRVLDPADGLPLGSMVASRYEVEEQFSEGGVGLLYRAHDHKLGRQVALKIMRTELCNHSALRPRFEQEAGALVALAHPNIVSIHDYGHVEERPYIVMSLLHGQTLRRRLDDGPMREHEAFHVVRQLLQGLAYAHDQGVAHRDLKPSNIFLERFTTQPDVVKMLDFGFAAFLDGEDAERNDLTDQDLGFGTPAYMPPEQLRGQLARPESDVYAVGLVLFEMLTGERPYTGDTRELMRAQLRQPLPELTERNPHVGATEPLRQLLSRATEKDPHARFPNASAMLEAIEALPLPATYATAEISGERPVSRADIPLQRHDETPPAVSEATTKPIALRGERPAWVWGIVGAALGAALTLVAFAL